MAVDAVVADRAAVGAADHYRLLIGVRWQCYRNALRKSSIRRAKFVTGVITWLLAAVGGIASALAFAGLGYAAGTKARAQVIGVGLFLVFVLWQLAPAIFEATAPMMKFRDIARYPVAFRTFYVLHLTYGLLDPAAMLSLIWLIFLWSGLLLGRSEWAIRAVIPFLLFATFNLLANRFAITLLDRVLATRKGRERVFFGIILLAVVAQLAVYGFIPRLGSDRTKELAQHLIPLWRWSPPGLATSSIVAHFSDFAVTIAALSAYSVIAAWLLRWQLRSVFSGEIYSESRRTSGAVQTKTGWQLPFVSGRTSAIIEKELRYCFGDSRTLMNTAMPTIFAAIIVISRGFVMRTMTVGLKVQSPTNLQVAFSGAAIFILAYVSYNAFGLEGAGFQRWPLSSATYREILVGKNLAVCLLWAMSFVAVNLVLLASGNYSLRLLELTLLGGTYGGLMVLAAGNQFSVIMPVKVESGSITSKVMSEGTMFGSIVLLVVVGGSVWLTVTLARRLALPWITPFALLVLASIAACLYAVSLNSAANYLERNLDKISAELE